MKSIIWFNVIVKSSGREEFKCFRYPGDDCFFVGSPRGASGPFQFNDPRFEFDWLNAIHGR